MEVTSVRHIFWRKATIKGIKTQKAKNGEKLNSSESREKNIQREILILKGMAIIPER